MTATAANTPFADWLEADLTLTPTELRLVEALAERFGEWVPMRVLARHLRVSPLVPEMPAADANTVRTHISRIRQKLRDTPWSIENHYFHGRYRLIGGEVESAQACHAGLQAGSAPRPHHA